jgi:hypothetical protein
MERPVTHDEHRRSRSAAEAGRVAHDRVEHRLEVGRRARDHAQDLRGGRPLLEGLGQVAVARLTLLRQSGFLDGQGGLVGEGSEQGDLLGGEGADTHATDRDDADGRAFGEERRREHRPDADRPSARLELGVLGPDDCL